MTDASQRVGCSGNRCDWALTGPGQPPVCVEGESTCASAQLLPAAVSTFHDQALAALTQQINALLAAVPPDPAGRKLSFLHTRQGTLLAWVDHDTALVDMTGAVTAASDDAAIAQALGLLS